MRYIFGELAPDQPPHLSKGLQEATNVYAAANGYRPVKQFVASHSALPSACKGAASFTSPQGENVIVAGTLDTLYRAAAGAWTAFGTGYSSQAGGRWRYAQFGGLAIAVNGSDAPVKLNLTDFTTTALGGNPPVMKLLAVVGDFLVGGVVNDDVTRLQWSAINNAEFWTVGQRQSDYQIMPTGGEITGIIGGEFGLILQKNRISRMDYVGGNTIFRFSEISTNIGCVSVHTFAQAGRIACFLSDTGFMMWTGTEVKPIGSERIDRYFASLYGAANWSSMSTSIDAASTLVIWSTGDKQFLYNWELDRWTIIDLAAEIVFGGSSIAVSIDDLDVVDTDPLDLDDEALRGGDPAFYLFNTSHVMGTLSGANMAATLTGGDLELARDRDARLRSVRPLTDAVDGVTLNIEARQRLGDTAVTAAYSSLSGSGDIPVRERGRYLRMSLVFAAGAVWDYVQGLDLTVTRGARR